MSRTITEAILGPGPGLAEEIVAAAANIVGAPQGDINQNPVEVNMIPGWVDSPIQVAQDIEGWVDSPIQYNENPLPERREILPDIFINNRIPYIQMITRLTEFYDQDEIVDKIIKDIRERMQEFYEKAKHNAFAYGRYQVEMKLTFQLNPQNVNNNAQETVTRSTQVFPIPMIHWRPVNQEQGFFPGVPVATEEVNDRNAINEWLDKLRDVIEAMIQALLDKLEDYEEEIQKIIVQSFAEKVVSTFIYRGASKPDFNAEVVGENNNNNLLDLPILQSDYVGCSVGSKETSTKGGCVLWSTSTKKNRCALYCVLKKLELGAPVIDDKGSTFVKKRKDEIIKDFLEYQLIQDGQPLVFPMAIKDFYKLADYFHCIIYVYVWEEKSETIVPMKDNGEVVVFGKEGPVVKLFIENGHSYLIVKEKMQNLSKKICPHCRTMYTTKHEKCDQTKIAYMNRRMEKNKKQITANEKFVQTITNRRCIFYDCETFTNEKGEHIPYAIGWGFPEEGVVSKRKNDIEEGIAPIKWKFDYRWGEGCMQKFIEWMQEYSDKTEKIGKNKKRTKKILIGFNNANYDNLLLAKCCIKLGMHFEFQIQNNALIGMETELFKTWDLCRFLPGQSLDSACKNFGASDADAKTVFPHKFIRGWEDLNYVGVEPGEEYHWKKPENWTYVTTPTWNLKNVCLNYLEKDIRGTIFVFNKLQETCFKALHVDIKEFITASHMSYDVWTNLVSNASKETNRYNPLEERKQIFELYYPTLEQEDIFRQAIYGGRTYNTARLYESPFYELVEKGMAVKYEDIDEWMDVFDVVSLYASAMLFFEYPHGLGQSSTDEELAIVSQMVEDEDYDELPLGIYKVKYTTNKKLVIPALPRKTFKTQPNGSVISQGLIWDLKDSTGYYTIIDIVEARKQGYTFEFISGVQWPCKGKIFEKYIELALELKCKGEEEGNETLRSLGKLLCNALYGKMLQRPILEQTALIKDGNDLDKFLKTNNLKDIVFLNDEDDRLLVVGEECQRELKIRKPSYIGAFVLSYSRKIMHNFAGMVDPYRGTAMVDKSLEKSFLYTDTDSLFYKTTPEVLSSLKEVLKENQPGSLWYDLKGKPAPKVLKAIFLGPKTYLLIYITKDGKIQQKMRSKGIPSSFLTKEDYENLLEKSQVERKEVPQIRKIMHHKKEQIPFTLIATKVEKCLMKELWKGRCFLDDSRSLPFGHESAEFLQHHNKNG